MERNIGCILGEEES